MEHTASANPYRLVQNVKKFEHLIDQMPGWFECERAKYCCYSTMLISERLSIEMSVYGYDDHVGVGANDSQAFIDLLGKLGAV